MILVGAAALFPPSFSAAPILFFCPPLSALRPSQVWFCGVPREAAVDPRGRYCYLFVLWQYADGFPVRTAQIVLVRYAIRSDGTLGQSWQQAFDATEDLSEPVFAPSGRFLYLLTAGGVRPFRVRSDGSITPLLPRSTRTGRRPLGMVYVQKVTAKRGGTPKRGEHEVRPYNRRKRPVTPASRSA